MISNRARFAGVFILLLLAKILISLFMQGPLIFSDESCVSQRAQYLAQHGEMAPCHDILGVDSGDPHPFYSVLISPIYLFVHGEIGYHAILILNAILVVMLLFPLYAIARRHDLGERASLFVASITVLLPQFAAYDTTLMTETIFSILCVWFVFAYLCSFRSSDQLMDSQSGRRMGFLFLALALASAAAFARPQGFVVIFSIIVNEIVIGHYRKILAVFFIPIATLLMGLTVYWFLPHMSDQGIAEIGRIFFIPDHFFKALLALRDQISSLTLTTYGILFIAYIAYLIQPNLPRGVSYLRLRYMLITFTLLSLIISTRQIYGYYLLDTPTGFLTRYITTLIIFVSFFGLLALVKNIQMFRHRYVLIGGLALFFMVPFSPYAKVKQSLNFDLSPFYQFMTSDLHNIISARGFMFVVFSIIILFCSILLICGRRRSSLAILSVVIFTHSTLVSHANITVASLDAPVVDYFMNRVGTRVLFTELRHDGTSNAISLDYWKLLITGSGGVRFVFLNIDPSNKDPIAISAEEASLLAQEYTHIVSTLELNLPKIATLDASHAGLPARMVNVYILP